MIVAAREFTSGAECIARAAALKAKFFNTKAKPVVNQAPEVKVIAARPYTPPPPPPAPGWTLAPTLFDCHVAAYRSVLHNQEMISAGEIELVNIERRTIQQIVVEVLQQFPGITIADLKGPSRMRPVVAARQKAMWVVRQEREDLSLPAIGRWFGGKDHTSVLHAIRKVEAQRAEA